MYVKFLLTRGHNDNTVGIKVSELEDGLNVITPKQIKKVTVSS